MSLPLPIRAGSVVIRSDFRALTFAPRVPVGETSFETSFQSGSFSPQVRQNKSLES